MSSKRKSGKGKWIAAGVVVIAIIGIAAYVFFKPVKSNYDSVEAKISDIATYYSFSGNIETKNRQTVMAEKVMQIAEIDVKEGDHVEEGDILMTSATGEEIKAEISGEITNLKVEENAQVMSGMTLLEIVDYDNLQVRVKVDEYDLKAVEEGKSTTVMVNALDKEIKGTIRSVSREGQTLNGVTFFIATIDLEVDESLKIGMSTEVTMQSEKAEKVVVLPIKAILFNDDNTPYVLKQNEKGLPVKTPVTTGINDGTFVEITSGAASGETILYTTASTDTDTGMFGGNRTASGTGGAN